MQKLVSNNPVLRFKLGRKIVKADLGTTLKALGYAVGLYTPESKNGILKTPQITGNYVYTTGGRYGRMATLDEIDKSWGSSKDQIISKYLDDVTDTVDDNGNLIKKTTSVPKKGTTSVPKKGSTGGTRSIGTSYQFGKMGGWNRSMGKGSINDQESLNMLEEMGMKGKSAKEVQDKINEVFGPNAVKSDDLWGNLSKKGLAALYKRWQSELKLSPSPITTPRNEDPNINKRLELLALRETPKLASDLQIVDNSLNFTNTLYRSVGPYEQGNSSTLKDYGIKDYNSLVNYVKNNPNAYISTDLTNTFGDVNNWNLLDFENQIGIGGHYGRMNRNALWGYLNGLKLKYNSLTPQKLGWMALRKQGGQLVSRNPIKRFKSNFRLVAQ